MSLGSDHARGIWLLVLRARTMRTHEGHVCARKRVRVRVRVRAALRARVNAEWP